jgi:outer membrane lipoprotein SlyB
VNKQFTTVLVTIAIILSFTFISSCSSDAGKGAGIGGLAGAGVGAIIGHQSGHTVGGALIGGAVGGGAGYIIGNERDKKKTQAEMDTMRVDENSELVTVTNNNGSKILIRVQRQGTGYIGPRGEYYDHLPTDAELRPLYGF